MEKLSRKKQYLRASIYRPVLLENTQHFSQKLHKKSIKTSTPVNLAPPMTRLIVKLKAQNNK